MMVGLFVLLGMLLLLAWSGYRKTAITCFAVFLVLASAWFWHHITSDIPLNL